MYASDNGCLTFSTIFMSFLMPLQHPSMSSLLQYETKQDGAFLGQLSAIVHRQAVNGVSDNRATAAVTATATAGQQQSSTDDDVTTSTASDTQVGAHCRSLSSV